MPVPHAAILHELRAHLGEWYPELADDVSVDLVDLDPRARSQLMRVRVVGRDAPRRTIIVKRTPDAPVAFDDRPRLVAPTDPPERLAQEAAGLELAAALAAANIDPLIGAVRPLGILPETGALAMEAYDGRPLHEMLIPGLVRRSGDLRATALVRRAGRWLRAFHALTPEDRPVRQGSRDAIVEAFQAVGSFLAANGAADDVDAIMRAGVDAVTRLPDPLPTAICHGDFAPRNILVDPSGRVAVIDISVKWQAPIYEDLASLLVALRMSRANALTRGRVFGPAVGVLEPAFLDGYFDGRPIPRAAIRVYELLLVLDKWSSLLSRSTDAAPRRRLQERAIHDHFAVSSRLLARRLIRR